MGRGEGRRGLRLRRHGSTFRHPWGLRPLLAATRYRTLGSGWEGGSRAGAPRAQGHGMWVPGSAALEPESENVEIIQNRNILIDN